MRQNPDFILRTVADSLVLVPVGEATEHFPGMARMNESSAFLWKLLTQEQTAESLTRALLEKYQVTEKTAQEYVRKFLKNLTTISAVV